MSKKLLYLVVIVSIASQVSHASLLDRNDAELDAEQRLVKYEDLFFLVRGFIANRLEFKRGLEHILSTSMRQDEVIRALNILKTRVLAERRKSKTRISELETEIAQWDQEQQEEYADAKEAEARRKRQSLASQAWAWATRKKEEPAPSQAGTEDYQREVPGLLRELNKLTSVDIPTLFSAIQKKFNSPAIAKAYEELLIAYTNLELAEKEITRLNRLRLDVANAEITSF